MNNIASSDTPSSTDIFAQYTYLGDGTIVGVAHPAVSGGLNLTYSRPSDSGGGLAGLDPASSAKLRRAGPRSLPAGCLAGPRHRPEMADGRV